jgi:drug/metabolite transporter (DMT)-like permease
MKFARYTFLIAGIYGLIALAPQYFLEAKNGQDFPPAITHPEYYYGFIGVALAWQIVFLMISQNPARYRPLMLVAAVFEKFPFTVAAIVLFLQGRLHLMMLGAGLVDGVLGVLFIIAFLKTGDEAKVKAL